MAQKNAVYQVDNGSGFDEVHFRTNENMITGANQNSTVNGYRKLPGGLILQWLDCQIQVDSNSRAYVDVNLPLALKNCHVAFGNVFFESKNTSDANIDLYNVSVRPWGSTATNLTHIKVAVRNSSSSSEYVAVRCLAIGY